MNDIYTEFALDTENPETNFNLALEYHRLGHGASAVTHYLRCAERTEDLNLAYECLLKSFFCFRDMQNRHFTAIHFLRHALTVLPKRPEAYFLLAQYHEQRGEHYDCYTIASIALEVCNFDLPSLRTNIGYVGRGGLLFEKAVSGWHWDKTEQTKEILLDLKHNYNLSTAYQQVINNNLKNFYGIE
jgi:tetratricopeptide (TPR) repeat protein